MYEVQKENLYVVGYLSCTSHMIWIQKLTYIYDKEIIKGVNKQINEVDPLIIL